jgi:adrenodoxin-NADP+ reductase
MKLPSVYFNPIDLSLIPPDPSKLPRASKRIAQLLIKGSENTNSSAPMSWSLDFLLSPLSFNATPFSHGHLSSVSFEKNLLSPDLFHPEAKAGGTGEKVDLPAELSFRSIGYKSEELPGLADLGIPFDERLGIIPNDEYGRVIDPARPLEANHVLGMYCAGWVKRGPTGVIASTMSDAFTTAEVIAQDWLAHKALKRIDNIGGNTQKGWDGLRDEAEQRGCRRVSWQDWKRIDSAERKRGKKLGKEREKFTTVVDMLAVLD